jgi:hypothetical protein
MIDTRELALLIWLSVLLAFALSKPDVRQSFRDTIKAFLHPKILIPTLIYLIYLSALIWFAWRLGLWSTKVLGPTILWFFLSGFVLFMQANRAGAEEHFFRRVALKTVGVAAFLEFFLNIKTFSLPVELLLQPIIGVLVVTQIVARDTKYVAARWLIDGLLGVIGLWLLIATVVGLIDEWQTLDYELLWQSLVLPIWLTIGSLPGIYLFSLIMEYESAFMRMKLMNERNKPSLAARLSVVVGFHGRIRRVHDFGGTWTGRVARQSSFRAALDQVRAFERDMATKEAEKREAAERLERYAGAEGVDETGRRLDQREFEETRQALQWIANCHMGWYRQRGRYRRDLMKILGDFTSYGLPEDHGIVMRVRKDGKSWYAWRRTISGWVFAIGAAKAPPDQWLYDGRDVPAGFPGKDPAWGESAFMESPNW